MLDELKKDDVMTSINDPIFSDLEGVYTGGIHCGIKDSNLDLGYIYVPEAVSSAGMFTTNNFTASSVDYTKKALKNNTTLKYEALKTGLINEKDYDRIVNPKKMIYPA